MQNRISVTDYNADWVYKERFLTPRSSPGYLTPEDIVRFYGTLGVDGLELTHKYWKHLPTTRLKEIASNADIPIICYLFDVDLAVPDSSRRHSLESSFRLLDRTAQLDAPFAMIVPAIVKQGVPLEEQRRWLIEGLHRCAGHAESVGVTLLIENLDDSWARPLLGQGIQCRKICEEVGSPALRLIYDSGATLIVGTDFLKTLHDMAPYLVHVHLKNGRKVGTDEHVNRYVNSADGARYIGTRLDQGSIDIGMVVSQLKQSGYNGYFLVEYQGEDDPREAIRHDVSYLRQLLGNLE